MRVIKTNLYRKIEITSDDTARFGGDVFLEVSNTGNCGGQARRISVRLSRQQARQIGLALLDEADEVER